MAPKTTDAGSRRRRSWMIGGILLTHIALFDPSGASAQSTLRADALLLMDAGLWPLGVAGLCSKEVTENPGLRETAEQWNKRHEAYFRKIIAVIKSTGDMTRQQKDEFDREAMGKIRAMVARQKDKPAFCQQHTQALREGRYDLDKNSATKEALARVMASNVN